MWSLRHTEPGLVWIGRRCGFLRFLSNEKVIVNVLYAAGWFVLYAGFRHLQLFAFSMFSCFRFFIITHRPVCRWVWKSTNVIPHARCKWLYPTYLINTLSPTDRGGKRISPPLPSTPFQYIPFHHTPIICRQNSRIQKFTRFSFTFLRRFCWHNPSTIPFSTFVRDAPTQRKDKYYIYRWKMEKSKI